MSEGDRDASSSVQLSLDSPETKARFDRNRQELSGSFVVSVHEVFPPSFMRRNTAFATIDLMLAASPVPMTGKHEVSDLDRNDRAVWESFIRFRTRFRSWEAMRNAACAEWLATELVKDRRPEPGKLSQAPQHPLSLVTVPKGEPENAAESADGFRREQQLMGGGDANNPYQLGAELARRLGFGADGKSHPTHIARSVERKPPYQRTDVIDTILGEPIEAILFHELHPLLRVAINGGGRVEWYGYWPKGGDNGEDTYFVIIDGAVTKIPGPKQGKRVIADSLEQATLVQQRDREAEWIRFWGAVQAFSGVTQIAGGLLLLVTSKGAAWYVAIPVILKGSDNAVTGLKQAHTGQVHQTQTNVFVTKATGSPVAGFAADVVTDLIGPGWKKPTGVPSAPYLLPPGKPIPRFNHGVGKLAAAGTGQQFDYHWAVITLDQTAEAVEQIRVAMAAEIQVVVTVEIARLRAMGITVSPAATAAGAKAATLPGSGGPTAVEPLDSVSMSKSGHRPKTPKPREEPGTASMGEPGPPEKKGGRQSNSKQGSENKNFDRENTSEKRGVSLPAEW